MLSHTIFFLNQSLNKIKFISLTSIGTSGKAWHFHFHLKKKMNLFCASPLYLELREFNCKMWIENDSKEASLNFLHIEENRGSLFWSLKYKIKPSSQGPLPRRHCSCLSAWWAEEGPAGLGVNGWLEASRTVPDGHLHTTNISDLALYELVLSTWSKLVIKK